MGGRFPLPLVLWVEATQEGEARSPRFPPQKFRIQAFFDVTCAHAELTDPPHQVARVPCLWELHTRTGLTGHVAPGAVRNVA